MSDEPTRDEQDETADVEAHRKGFTDEDEQRKGLTEDEDGPDVEGHSMRHGIAESKRPGFTESKRP
jgi:hypothetical protein